jgi:hypothetical protein
MLEHVGQPVLVQFVNGRLNTGETEDVFGHLAHCGACRTRVEALRSIAQNPAAALSEFGLSIANAHGAVPQRRFRAALRVVVDRARGVASIASEGLESLVTMPESLRIVPIPASVGVGDAGRLAQVSPSSVAVEMRIAGSEIGSATVVADARRGAVSVLLHPPAGTTAAALHAAIHPRASLLDSEGRRCHESRFELVPGAEYLLAEFEHLEDTQWVLGLELDA